MSTAVVKLEQRGVTAREDFSGTEVARQAETAVAAVTARERALVESLFVMAERHPRNWLDVRQQMLAHCDRPKFAEVARYKRPAGRKKVNGQWVESFAEGFSTRFTETLMQEMGNVDAKTQVIFEDELIRIARFGVLDLQKNVIKSREVTIAKAVERSGKKKPNGEFDPPAGREVLSVRTNSYGEPSFLVRATDDELRAKTNAEESKTQRDIITRLCPRDILEECEEKIAEVAAREDKRDPTAAVKKLLDGFGRLGLRPSDLEQYMGKPVAQFTAADRAELKALGVAIHDGQTTFDDAMRIRFSPPDGEEATSDRDVRNQHNLDAQDEAARQKIAELERQTTASAQEHFDTSDFSTSNEGEKQEAHTGQKPARGFGGVRK